MSWFEQLEAIKNVKIDSDDYDPEKEMTTRAEIFAAATDDVLLFREQIDRLTLVRDHVVAALRAGIHLAAKDGHDPDAFLTTAALGIVYDALTASVVDDVFQAGLPNPVSAAREGLEA